MVITKILFCFEDCVKVIVIITTLGGNNIAPSFGMVRSMIEYYFVLVRIVVVGPGMVYFGTWCMF